MKNIVIVLGRICSGKDYYCSQFPDYFHVATSTVVKSVGKTGPYRTELYKTKQLHTRIGEGLVSLALDNPKIIIDGIRQVEVLDYLIQAFGLNAIDLIWLEVPTEIRKKRFYSRNSEKDSLITFEQGEQGDIDLGIETLYQKYYNKFIIHKNY